MVCVRTRAGSPSRARTALFTTPTRCRRLTRLSRRTSASCSSEHRKPNPTTPTPCGRTNTRTDRRGPSGAARWPRRTRSKTALPRSKTHSIRSPDLLGGRLDQTDHIVRMRNHRQVVRIDLDHSGAPPLGEKPLRVRWNSLVTLGDEVPRHKGLPRDLAHHFLECADGQRLLRCKQYLGLDGID